MGGLLVIKKKKGKRIKTWSHDTYSSLVQFRAIENRIVIETKIYLLTFDSRRVKVTPR